MTMYLIFKQQKNYSIRKSISCAFCFKQLPLNNKQKFEFLYHLIDGKRPLLIVVGVIGFLADKTLYFYNTNFI